MKKIKNIIIATASFYPSLIFAQSQLTQTNNFFIAVKNIVSNLLIPLAFTLALLFFFWGVAKYIRSEGNDKAQARQIMVWGVIALFVMSAVWGLVRFIRTEFGIGPDTNITIPTVNGGSGGTGGLDCTGFAC